jgi:hypothetical protein
MIKRIERTAVAGTRWTLPLLTALFALLVCAGAQAQPRGRGAELLKELDNAYVEIWNKVAPAVVNVDTQRVITLPELPPFSDSSSRISVCATAVSRGLSL